MKVIGITGGVGSGKSALLSYIKGNYNCRILLADEVAHRLKEPGEDCYEQLILLLSEDVLNEDKTIHKGKMAEKIFHSRELLSKVNEVIHPAVKRFILKELAAAREENKTDFFFIEAALLIEEGYLTVVDEMWYIYASADVRRRRLKSTRNYSDEKIDAIMASQLAEEEFRKYCKVVIDNSGSLEAACEQIDRELGDAR